MAEAEVSRLRKALNAKSAAATTVTGQEVSFIPGTNGTNGIDASAGAVNSGSATSDLGVAIGGGNKDKATNVSTADALNTSVTSSPTAVSPYTSPVISVDEKSGVKSGGGSGGSLAPAATVGQQQHMRQHTLPTSSAVMRELRDYEALRTPARAFLPPDYCNTFGCQWVLMRVFP